MTGTSDADAVVYELIISEDGVEAPLSQIVPALEERVPRLAAFIAKQLGDNDTVVLPRTFTLDQALRLQRLLQQCHLRSTMRPVSYNHASQQSSSQRSSSGGGSEMDPQTSVSSHTDAMDRLRSQQVEPEVARSRFLMFGLAPKLFPGTAWKISNALLYRMVGVSLGTVVVMQMPMGQMSAGQMGLWGLIPVTVLSFFVDWLVIAVGKSIFAPAARITALDLQYLAAPTYLLDAIPFAGSIVGSFWRMGLYPHGLIQSGQDRGTVVYVAILPWMSLFGFAALIALFFMVV